MCRHIIDSTRRCRITKQDTRRQAVVRARLLNKHAKRARRGRAHVVIRICKQACQVARVRTRIGKRKICKTVCQDAPARRKVACSPKELSALAVAEHLRQHMRRAGGIPLHCARGTLACTHTNNLD